MRAIVVDDHTGVRFAVRRLLSRAGFDVVEATSGPEALTMLADADPFDLAIVDRSMPVMSGLALVENIRTQHRHDRMKLMMLTADPDDAHSAMVAGVDAYLVKPLLETTLRDRLRALGFAVQPPPA